MTLLDAIEEVAADINLPIQYANLEEANWQLDTTLGWPVLVVIPFEVKDKVGVSSLLESSAPLIMYVLDKDDASTIEVKTRQVEHIIADCRTKAREFMYKLLAHDIIDITKPKDEVTYTPTYSQSDANAHGVAVITKINFIEGVSGC